jgi:lipoate-protein ligase B
MLYYKYFGKISYLDALEIQKQTFLDVYSGKLKGFLLFFEHDPVITIGRRGSMDDVLVDRFTRLSRGIRLFYADRGGGVTYHCEGQLIIYPVLNLNRMNLKVSELIELCGSVMGRLLSEYQIKWMYDQKRPGIYVSGKKIASLGFHIHRGISTHGIALNVSGDISGFSMINPCREHDLEFTTIENILGAHMPIKVIVDKLIKIFEEVFKTEIRYHESES